MLSRDNPLQLSWQCEVDARGLHCPVPILRAKKALATMDSGQILKVLTSDPGSPTDFTAFCEQTGNQLLLIRRVSGEEFIFFLKRR